MNKAYRHGEILLLKIKAKDFPKGLEETKTNLIEKGSHNNSHTFKGGKIYFKKEDNFTLGYLKAKDTKLYHKEHGNKDGEKIENGVYKIIKQVEFTPKGLVPVVD